MPIPHPTATLHFGIDDVLPALLDASDSQQPLFSHPFFATLAALHSEFAFAIDLYLFLEVETNDRRRSLREVATRLRADLIRAPWLRLGPHGRDALTPPYRQTTADQRAVFTALYAEIDRLVGAHQRSTWVRLHCFSESYALADLWLEHGVDALLTTDRPAIAYHLPDAERAELAAHGQTRHQGITARRTHERAELLATADLADEALAARLDVHAARHGCLVLCTHEYELSRPPVLATLRRCLRHARHRNWRSQG